MLDVWFLFKHLLCIFPCCLSIQIDTLQYSLCTIPSLGTYLTTYLRRREEVLPGSGPSFRVPLAPSGQTRMYSLAGIAGKRDLTCGSCYKKDAEL